MVTAYIMVKANTGDADRLRRRMTELEGVLETHIVAGDVDFIAKVEVEAPAEVKDIAASGIQDIPGVEDTQTYISMD